MAIPSFLSCSNLYHFLLPSVFLMNKDVYILSNGVDAGDPWVSSWPCQLDGDHSLRTHLTCRQATAWWQLLIWTRVETPTCTRCVAFDNLLDTLLRPRLRCVQFNWPYWPLTDHRPPQSTIWNHTRSTKKVKRKKEKKSITRWTNDKLKLRV